MTKLVIQLEMPEQGAPAPEQDQHSCSPEDKVRKAIELVDSGYCSDVHWLMLKKLYNTLQQKKPTKRITNLMAMIQPVLFKYGYYEAGPDKKRDKK